MEPFEFSDEPSVSWAQYFAAFAAVVEKAPLTGVVDLTEQVCHLNAITHGFGYSDHVSLFFTATKALKLPGTPCDADFRPLEDLASVATQLAVPASGADEHAGRVGLYLAAFYAAVECFIVAPRSELHTQAFTDLKALCSTRVAPFLTTQLRQRVVTPEAVHDSVKRFSMFDETISDSSSRSRWLAKQCSQLLGIRTALEASDSPYGASSNAAPPQEARPKQPSPLPPQVASPTSALTRYPLQPVANSSGVKRGELTSSSLSTPTPSPPTLAPAKPVYRPTVAKQGGFLVVSRPPNLLAPKPLLTSPLSSTPTSGPKLQQQLDVSDISFATPQAQLPSMPSIVQGTPLAQAGVGSFLPPRILAARSPSPPRRGHR